MALEDLVVFAWLHCFGPKVPGRGGVLEEASHPSRQWMQKMRCVFQGHSVNSARPPTGPHLVVYCLAGSPSKRKCLLSHCNHVSIVPPSGDQELDTGTLDDALHPNQDTAHFLFYEVSNYNRQSASQRGERREGSNSEQSALGGGRAREVSKLERSLGHT